MNTGVQRVVRELFRALSAQEPVTPLVWDPALAAYCALSRRERGFLERPFAAGGASDAEPGRRANPVPIWSKFARRIVHRRNRIDLPAITTAGDTLFVPEIFQDNRVEWLARLGELTPVRRVGVCHDAIAWRRPGLSPPAREAGFTGYLDTLGTFDEVVAISRQTSDELGAFWRECGRSDFPPVSVHPWPANHAGTPRQIVPPHAGTSRPQVLCVGTFEPRKNHLLLFEAADSLWTRGFNFEVTLIGRTTAHWGARVLASIETLQAARRPVRWLRHVDDQALRQAYEQCAFTVFPSLAEGFGLPILESLWYGRPCVCGGNGALGEVSAGGGCLTVDQTDASSLATGIERLLTDQPLYGRLSREAAVRTFSTWESLVAELIPLLQPVPETGGA